MTLVAAVSICVHEQVSDDLSNADRIAEDCQRRSFDLDGQFGTQPRSYLLGKGGQVDRLRKNGDSPDVRRAATRRSSTMNAISRDWPATIPRRSDRSSSPIWSFSASSVASPTTAGEGSTEFVTDRGDELIFGLDQVLQVLFMNPGSGDVRERQDR